MHFDPDIHHRRSIRLRNFDYSTAGAYFVTVCVQGRECLLGEVVDGQMRLNDAGKMVAQWWRRLPEKFPQVIVDEHVVMPNHFHGIVVFVGAPPCGCPPLFLGPQEKGRPHGAAPTRSPHGRG